LKTLSQTCLLAAYCAILAWSGPEITLADSPPWKTGAAKVVITPAEPMPMAGYASRQEPATGTLTDLWAKALILEDADQQRAALITLDLVGIDRTLYLMIRERLETKCGLEPRQIAICCSHTHTGPVVGLNLGPMHYFLFDDIGKKRLEAYVQRLVDDIEMAVQMALDAMTPSRVKWGVGRSEFAVNRRNNPEAEVPALRAQSKLNGPVDHDVPVLAVYDEEDRLLTTVFGYACHATVLGFREWSGDYPGFAQLELETRHPDCVAMFVAGCGADQNPLPRHTVALAQHYGRRLANAVEAVLLTSEMEELTASVKTQLAEIPLPFGELPTRDQLESDSRSENQYVANRARLLLRDLDAQGLDQTYPYPIGLWRLGDQVNFVTLGGEVVVDYSIRLKQVLKGQPTWVAGYVNDVMAYIPSRRVLQEGGYEGGGAMVFYGLPTVWAPEVEPLIVTEVRNLAAEFAD